MNIFERYEIKCDGFTLIEVMIVISIIGILAAIAIPNFIIFREKTYCTLAESDAYSIKASLSAYFSSGNRTIMPSVDDLIKIERLVLNNNKTDVTLAVEPDVEGTIKITVKDSSGRCRNGNQYVSYMGSGMGQWQ